MKYFILAILFPLNLLSQSAKWNPSHLDDRLISLKAEYIAPASITLPFSSIKIIDSRFDTTKLGFVLGNTFFASKTNLFKKLKLEKGVAIAIEEYYNDYYQKSLANNDFKLVIVIKKLWFSSFDAGKTKTHDRGNGNSSKRGSMLCKWEYYVGKDDMYLPVKRTDTTFQLSDDLYKSIKSDFAEKEIIEFKFFLKVLMETPGFEKKIMAFGDQPKKTIAEINEYNNKRFDLNIIKDSVIKKGVYMNFNEFKANRPSVTVFTEKNMKYGTLKKEEYLEDEQGNTINPFWGYSNGEWMKYGVYTHDYIYRVNNTFEFFSKETTLDMTGKDPSSSMTRTFKYDLLIPVQIDMETGEIY
jgi:hypothetical protein